MANSSVACAPCVFGAVRTPLLQFPVGTIQTLTVSKIPHVTVYPSTNITSWQTVTQSGLPAAGRNTSGTQHLTFSDINTLTWTVGDATLTYPTTYMQFSAFGGAGASTIIDGQECARTRDALPITLPTSTNAASFIYPWDRLDPMPLPSALLDYLGSLPGIDAQLGGAPPASCAWLTPTPTWNPTKPTTWWPSASRSSRITAGCGGSPEQERFIAKRTAEGSFTTSQVRFKNTTSTGSSSSSSTHSTSSSTLSAFGVTTSTSTGSLSANQTSSTMKNSTTGASCPANSSITSTHGPIQTISTAPPSSLFSTRPPPVCGGCQTVPTPVYQHTTAWGMTVITATPVVVQGTGSPPPGDVPIVGGTTKNFHNPAPEPTPSPELATNPPNPVSPSAWGSSVFSFSHTKVTNNGNSGVVIGHTTLHAGHSVTLGSGSSQTTFALQTKGGTTHLVVDGTTYNPQPDDGVTRGSPNPTVKITENGQTLTAIQSGSSIIVEGGRSKTTIAPGSVITFDGQTISAPRQGGSSVIVNGKTTIFSNALLTTASEAVITTDGQTITAIQQSGSIVLEGASTTTTVGDGSVVTFERVTVSGGRDGSSVVFNGKTMKITPTTAYIGQTDNSAAATLSNPFFSRWMALFWMALPLSLAMIL